MSSEGSDSTICSDIIFRDWVNSYSCDEIVLDIFYNGCLFIYAFNYDGDALELKISKGCKLMYEMANLHGHLEVRRGDKTTSKSPKDLQRCFWFVVERDACMGKKEKSSPCYLISPNPLKPKFFPSDLKGKSLLDDFDDEEGEGLGSLSSKCLSGDLKGKSLLDDFEKVEGEGEGLGSSSSKFRLV
nr:hypothetical protein [Tanacetum cinerariifolium]